MHPNHATIQYLGILSIITGVALAGVKHDWSDVVWDTPKNASGASTLMGSIRRDPSREVEGWWQDNAFNDKVEFVKPRVVFFDQPDCKGNPDQRDAGGCPLNMCRGTWGVVRSILIQTMSKREGSPENYLKDQRNLFLDIPPDNPAYQWYRSVGERGPELVLYGNNTGADAYWTSGAHGCLELLWRLTIPRHRKGVCYTLSDNIASRVDRFTLVNREVCPWERTIGNNDAFWYMKTRPHGKFEPKKNNWYHLIKNKWPNGWVKGRESFVNWFTMAIKNAPDWAVEKVAKDTGVKLTDVHDSSIPSDGEEKV